MPTARLPLVTNIESRQPTTNRDSRMVNALKEGERVIKRPGLELLASSPALPTGPGQGLFSWNNYLIAANSNNIYAIAGGVSSNLGSIIGSQVPLTFTKTASQNYMAINDGSNIYTVTKAGMTVTNPLSSALVQSVTVNNHGLGYTSVPSVTFSAPPAGITATGHATIFNGQVAEVILDNQGTGYTSPPTVTIAAPTGTFNAATGTCAVGTTEYDIVYSDVWGYDFIDIYAAPIVITNGGGPYLTPPTVTITWTPPAGALYPEMQPTQVLTYTGYAVLTNNTVSSVVLTSNPKSNLTKALTAPILGLAGAGSLGTFTVTFSAAAGTTATATANMANTITGPYAYGIEYLDGYVFVLAETGRIYTSDYEDPSTWDALNYISAESEPDKGMALVKHLNYLIAFGEYSTDFFYNAGNAVGSPLSVNKQAKLEFGCASGPSVAKAEQTLLWVSNSKTQGRCVYKLDGLTPTKVSNRYIEKYLNRAALQVVFSYCMKIAGHTLYVLTLDDSNITFVYDLNEEHWYQWTSQSGGVETYFKYIYYSGNVEYDPNIYLQHDDDGHVYIMDQDYYKDATNDIWFRIVTNNLDSGSQKRKFVTKVEVVGDKVDGDLSIRHSDDDYITWSPYRTVNLQLKRPILYQCGNTRRRAYEVFSSDDIPIRLEALEMTFDIGEQGGGQEG